MRISCLLLILFVIVSANKLECERVGYKEYLELYTFKPSELIGSYYEEHYSNYNTYCKKYNYKKQNGDYADVTALMDWSNEELDELGDLSVKYSGISSLYEEIKPTEMEMHVAKTTREFPELMEYSVPEKKCSTSWVTSAIEIAEAALENRIRLSSKQLFECLPKEEGIDKCKGVSTRMLTQYLSETGLMSEDDFKDCESIDPQHCYRFNSISPDVPTGSGLMNLMFDEKKPVLVLVALSLDKLRFVKDMSNMDEGYKCGGYQPSVYGVLTGYKNSGDEDSWWEIRSRVVPGEEIVLKLPMSLDMTTANYGGIAAYAFTLRSFSRETVFSVNEEDFPSIEDIPDFATELVFAKNSYPNEMYLDLSRFTELKKVTIENGAFANADSLYISNPYMIETVIGDGCFNGRYDTGRRLMSMSEWYENHSHGLSIHDGRKLENLIVGSGSMIDFKNIRLIHVKVDVSIQVGPGSLTSVKQIEIPIKGMVDEDVEIVSETIEESIIIGNVNITVTIEVIRFEPREDELIVPTYPPIEVLPSTFPTEIMTEAPTTIPTERMTETPTNNECNVDLIVSSESDCSKLNENGWKTITVNERLCNEFYDDLNVCDNPCLQEIIVKKNSLKYVNMLKISNNTQLKRIEIGDDELNEGVLNAVQTVVIESSLIED